MRRYRAEADLIRQRRDAGRSPRTWGVRGTDVAIDGRWRFYTATHRVLARDEAAWQFELSWWACRSDYSLITPIDGSEVRISLELKIMAVAVL